MSQENWRRVNQRDRGRGRGNWRNPNDAEENRSGFTGSGRFPGNLSRRPNNRDFSRSQLFGSGQTPLRNIASNNLLNPQFLANLAENESLEHITSFLTSNMEEFVKILASELSDDVFMALLKLTAKACQNSFVSSKSYLLRNTMQEKFVATVCLFFSRLLANKNSDPTFWTDVELALDCVLVLLESSIQLIPMSCWEYVQSVTKTLSLILPVLRKNNMIQQSESAESRIASLKNDLAAIERKFKKPAPTSPSNDETSDGVAEEPPEDDYRYLNVYPTTLELLVPERPYLRKNIVNGKFPSLQDYLDIHFRLLREDFLNPIRQDVCDFLNRSNNHLFNIKIHKNAHFLRKDIIRNNVCFELQFNLADGLKAMIKSKQNKRFMHGTLLFFSDNNFESLFCGKVVGSDDLERGLVLVNLPEHPMPIVSYTKAYTMIECVIFFEPYYQVLSVFQRLSRHRLPMEKYILNVETNISPPKYMENITNYELPNGLNRSQADALHAALNKEFVIIQGPPGTGKTFLGMVMVKMMLNFRKAAAGSGPILLVTFTNHALEQFLTGIRGATNKKVRLGRNSSDLRQANEQFGPEALLEKFLDDQGYLRDFYRNYRDYEISMNHFEDDRLKDNERYILYKKRLIRDFVGYISGHFPLSKFLERFVGYKPLILSEIPLGIKSWLRSRRMVNHNLRLVKEVETEIKTVKSEIRNIFDMEQQGIFVGLFLNTHNSIIKKARENIAEYYFQDIQLACWLLCDDGTISSKQGNAILDPREEESKIFYLLSNFVFGDYTSRWEQLHEINRECISVSELSKKASEFKDFIENEKSLREVHRKICREQLNFFFEKIKYLEYCLKTDFGSPEVGGDVPNPFMIPAKNRWQLYKSWIETYKRNLREQVEDDLNKYETLYDSYHDLREMDNVKLLRTMDIVAMTTTCAARMRPTLEQLKCPIVLVEEAAEVLESHIITALTDHCQHLILLGDHQQLRPTTSDYTIEKKYKLGISLFERMVQNNVECHTLNVQHRMRPEISSLISPLFYKELFNDGSVEKYPAVSGVQHPLYFIDHTEWEEPYGDSSKMNVHEAKFLIQLAIYLLNNNYKPDDITILAAYLGQMYELKKEQEKSGHPAVKSVRIAVVDNFQGEENNIILLSLVRSNPENKIGFLSTDNRVCVALSRAKVGFYIMGNMEQLCASTEIWKSIKSTLKAQSAIGRFLPLLCKNHAGHVTLVSKDTDFSKVPQGGCDKPCNERLDCGHNCVRICHGNDKDHKSYNCEERCSMLLCSNEAHKCRKFCFEKCGPCHYSVRRHLTCGHEKTLACHVAYEQYKCQEPKELRPDCGHVQNIACSLDIAKFQCQVEVERTLPKCQHLQTMPCSKDVDSFECQFKVEVTLQCGHKMETVCSAKDEKVVCQMKCGKVLSCGHHCTLNCHVDSDPDHKTYECRERCTKNLRDCNDPEAHGKCTLQCHQRCDSCTTFVIKSNTNCSHIEKLMCSEATTYRRCHRPCSKKLLCGHLCRNKCWQPCSSCDQYTYKKVPECGHKIITKCSESPLQRNCLQPCIKLLICGHNCKERCNETCTIKCLERCQKNLDCGHPCIKKCHENCACRIKVIPECGHAMAVQCGEEVSQKNCIQLCRKGLPCGHSKQLPCNTPSDSVKCREKCVKPLECGHGCQSICGEECTVKCSEPCKKKLPCGHSKQLPCNTPSDSVKCREKCVKPLECGHTCQSSCAQECTVKCTEPCKKKLPCGHLCNRRCFEDCPTQCETICRKLLPCGHYCKQRCGEDCICIESCRKRLECGCLCIKLTCSEPCECKNKCLVTKNEE